LLKELGNIYICVVAINIRVVVVFLYPTKFLMVQTVQEKKLITAASVVHSSSFEVHIYRVNALAESFWSYSFHCLKM